MPEGARLYPVGRLDQDSEGLLLLTNDGAWSERVLHPRFGVEREYAIGLRAPLDAGQVAALKAGIQLEEGLGRARRACGAMTAIEADELIGLHPAATAAASTGTGRRWRRAGSASCGGCSARSGAPIERLVRVRIGPVRIDGLRSGAVRPLKAPEIRGLAGGGGRSRRAGRPAD